MFKKPTDILDRFLSFLRPVVLVATGIYSFNITAAEIPATAISPVGAVRDVENRTAQREQSVISSEVAILKQISSHYLPPDAAETFFVLRELSVDGSSILSQQEIAKLVASNLGQRLSLTSLLAVGAQFKKAYNDAGYIVPEVVVPVQKITNGVAKLKIQEYAINRVTFLVDGKPSAPPADLKATADLVTHTRPLTRQIYSKVINDIFRERSDIYVVDAVTSANVDGGDDAQIELTRDPAKRPPSGSLVIQPRLDSTAPPPDAERLRFRLNDVVITGVTAYDQKSVHMLFQDMIGREILLADIFSATAKLQQRYDADDYTKVQVIVPPQIIANGVINIKVKEYAVDRVVVTFNGKIADSTNMTQRIANQTTQTRPLRNSDIERYMKLMSDIPGVKVGGFSEPEGPEGPVYISADRRSSYKGFITTDNRGNRSVGPYQTELGLSLYSPFGWDDKLTIGATFTPQTQEMLTFRLKEELPINPEGLTAFFSVSHTQIQPGSKLSSYYMETLGDKFGIRLRYPFIRSADFNWYGYGHFAYANETTTGFNDTYNISDDRLRSFRVGNTLEFTDAFAGSNRINLEFSLGVNALGAQVTPIEMPDSYRPGLHPNYRKLVLDASREQPLTEALSLSLGLSAQYGFTVIPAAELFAFGGSDYGRGYLGTAAYGDSGIMGKAELVYTYEIGNTVLNALQPYIYYDVGRAWLRDIPKDAGVKSIMDGTSVGFGTRMNLLNYVTAELSFNQALSEYSVNGHLSKDPLYLFNVRVDF